MVTAAPCSVVDRRARRGAAQQVHAEQVGDVARAGPGGDLGDGAGLGDRPGLEDDDVVGERERVERVVGDEHGRAGEVGEVAAQVAAHRRCGCRRRARRAARRAAAAAGRWRGPGPARPAAPGRRRGPGAWRRRARSTPTRSSQLGGRGPGARAWARPRPRAERDVVEHGEVGEQQVVLEHDADRRAPRGHEESGGGSSRTCAVERDAPGVDRRQSGEARSTVVLPAPFGPSRASDRPRGARERRRRGRRSPSSEAESARVEGHAARAAIGRAATTITTSDTASSTRLRAMATSGRLELRGRRRAAGSGCGR